MRGGAAIHWFSGQIHELPDRCFCCLRVASWPCLHRSRALFAEGLDRRSGSPEDHIRAGRRQLFDQTSACGRDDRARPCGCVPFRWVAADSVYGIGDIERDLRQAGKGYVLGVNSNHWFASWGKPQRVVGAAEEIAKTQQRPDWRRLSAGAGTKGPRLHDCATSNWPISKANSLTITARSFGHVAC